MRTEAHEPWVWVPFEVDKRFDGHRVDQFLAQRLVGYSRARVQKILKESRVVRTGRPIRPSTKVCTGDKILIAYPRRPEPPLAVDASLPILYEDSALLVINKPADLLSHPTDKIHQHTVVGILRHFRPDITKAHLLHRLDRETSGVLALAKTLEAARAWADSMVRHRVRKEYIAFVHGTPCLRRGVIDTPIGRQGGDIKVRQGVGVPGAVPAVTRYEVITTASLTPTLSLQGRGQRVRDGLVSVLRVFPETGRLHQIRVHFASLGHPLLGDVLYTGDGRLYMKMIRNQLTPDDRQGLGFPRLALHAERLTLPHPLTGKPICIIAPLPRDMADFMQSCGPAQGVAKIDTLTSAI